MIGAALLDGATPLLLWTFAFCMLSPLPLPRCHCRWTISCSAGPTPLLALRRESCPWSWYRCAATLPIPKEHYVWR